MRSSSKLPFVLAAALAALHTKSLHAQWVPATSRDEMDGTMTTSISTTAVKRAGHDSLGILMVTCSNDRTNVAVFLSRSADWGEGALSTHTSPVRYKFDSLAPVRRDWARG